jgi:hypothetical protein
MVHALAGKARVMAGPKPFQSARTPSALIVFEAQSMKPEYVPLGADWSRLLIVCKRGQKHDPSMTDVSGSGGWGWGSVESM